MKAVLVDGSNLYFALSSHGRGQVHMDLLARWLDPGAEVKRFYTAPFRGHAGFLKALEKMGWRVRMGSLKEEREKRVDVALAVDMVLLAAGGATAITLVSGDADLIPAVEAAKGLGAWVRVAQFQDAIARDLAKAAHEVVLLDSAPWDALRWQAPAVARA